MLRIFLHEQVTYPPSADAARSFDKGLVIVPSWLHFIFKKVQEFAGFSLNLHKIQPRCRLRAKNKQGGLSLGIPSPSPAKNDAEEAALGRKGKDRHVFLRLRRPCTEL